LKDAGIINTKKTSAAVDIDMDDIERRLVILPMKAGNYSNLSAIKGCLVLILVDSFLRYPQLDKMTVFYVLSLVVHLCSIS